MSIEKYINKLNTEIRDNKEKVKIAEALKFAFPKPNKIEIAESSNTDWKIELRFPMGEEITTEHLDNFEEKIKELMEDPGDKSFFPAIQELSILANQYYDHENKTHFQLSVTIWI